MIDKIMDLGEKFVNTRLMSEFLDWFGALSPFKALLFLVGVVVFIVVFIEIMYYELYHIKYGWSDEHDYYEGCDEEMRRKGL